MKYLSEYMEDKQTEAFNHAGAFFAFSKNQLEENQVEGIDYCHLSSGLICPKDKASWLVDEISIIAENAIKQDIEENGIEGIIKRELSNHEAYYSYDIDATCEKLSDYPGITRKMIKEIFLAEYPKQDL